MTRQMVDTMVLIQAVKQAVPNEPNNLTAFRQDCKSLLLGMETIGISTITYTEFMPHLRDEERREYRELLQKLEQFDFGPPAAQIASELIRKHLQKLGVCRKCWNTRTSMPCKTCGAKVSRPVRLNDFYIAATAASVAEIEVLYTYDFLYLADDLEGRVDLRKPPNSSGPLFDDEGNELPDNVLVLRKGAAED